METKNILIIKRIVIFGLLALSLLSVAMGIKNAISYSQDFQWDAAKVLSMGINPYDESLNPSGVLERLGYDEYYKQMEANQFPSLLFILFPYVLFNPLTARYLWLVTNLIVTGLILFLMKKTFFKNVSNTDFCIVGLLMLSGTPWRNQIGVGQHTLFSFMFFLLAVYFSERYNNYKGVILSGIMLSVCYFKYTLTVPLVLYFIYKKKWKEIIISVVPHALLTVVFSIYLKDSLLNMIIKPLKVASVLTSEGSMDVGSILGGGYFTMVITLILMVGLFVMALVLQRKEGMDEIFISVLTLWSLVITYHRVYDYFVMVLPLCFFIKNVENKGGKLMLTIYSLLTVMVFYVLRILSNTGESSPFVTLIYYIFLIWMTVYTVRGCYYE